MTNKEFIAELAKRTETSSKDCQQLVEKLIEIMADALDDGDTINVQGFGSFETKKKTERVIVNPAPKLTVGFKPSTVLKEKIRK